MRPKVYLRACGEYDVGRLTDIIEQGARSLGFDAIKPGMRVAVKVNLLMKRTPPEATTTHPAVAEAVCRFVQSRGATPVICDSPSGLFNKERLRGIYGAAGMEAAAESCGAELNYDLSSSIAGNAGSIGIKAFEIIDAVGKADAVISVCKLKTHGMMYFSGAVKNMFGCIPGLLKAEYHYRCQNYNAFSQMLVDLCRTVRPVLSIMDGIWSMEGDGPSAGTPRHTGFMLMSESPDALDFTACDLVRFDRKNVPTLCRAVEMGICPDSMDGIELLGDDIEALRVDGFRPPASKALTFTVYMPPRLRNLLCDIAAPKPRVNTKICVGCGECARDCPVHTIRCERINGETKAVIDRKNCIKCYCCHEVCPQKAIVIARFK